MKKIFALIFLMFSSMMLLAQEDGLGSLSGSVTEELSGESVISLTIAIFPDSNVTSSKPIAGAVSNKFGYYSVPGIKPGSYYLVARGVGYATYIEKISIGSNESVRRNIKMKVEDVRMQEITVEAQRDEPSVARISTVTVTPDFVSKMPSLGGEVDVFRVLQLLPGVQQASELSSGLYVRGGSPDQNLNLLDGVIVYNPSHLGGFLSVFNADALRDIKLIKGAFPAEYGGRLSSVLDMTMKEGTKEKFSGSGGVSMISSRLTLEGPINDNSTFMVSGRRMYLDVLTWLAGGGTNDEVPIYYFYDLNAKLNYQLSDSDRLFVSGFFGRDVLKEPESSNENFGISWGNSTANIRWMHILSPQIFTNFSLIYTDYTFNTEIYNNARPSENFNSGSHIKDIMLRAEAQYFPAQNHTIKTGLETIWHNFRSELGFDMFDEVPNEFTSKELQSLEASLYFQDEWKVSELMNANIGARIYYFQGGDYFAFEPRLSASYKLTDKTSMTGSLALAHQFLHLIVRNDITLPTDLWFPSTEKIQPSKSWQGVLGVEHIFAEGEYLFSAEVYYKDMKNLYEYKEGSYFSLGIPIEEQFTSGRGVAYGLELFLNKQIGSFTGWIGYTLAWTKRQFDEINGGRWFSPRYDRRHDINLVLTYKLGENWELGASWVYGTGQAFTMPTGVYSFPDVGEQSWGGYERYQYTDRNGARLPAFHKMDLNFMYKFSWFDLPFQLSMNIYNVYNRKNPFAWYISDWDEDTGEYKKTVRQVTLFPIIPTLGLSFKF
ncbi:MAG: TonB-dependent receptor plug domain-containing protein [Candidatus Kapabacteria bacterium]|nr:TonB-dependent receptor plug domain-containing protein [Candidatus Kapabacteria bacterium]